MIYSVKKPEELTDSDIKIIIDLWENEEWFGMSSIDFKILFKDSEFHVLSDSNGKIASILRLNFDFTLKISENSYSLVEMGGFASLQKRKGYGSQLLQLSMENIIKRDLETIGFCFSALRPFYEKYTIPIIYNGAKHIQEKNGNDWAASEDDDILIIHLSEGKKNLLKQLNSEHKAYLI